MQQKKLFLIFVSLSVVFGVVGIFFPWCLTLAGLFAASSTLIAYKMTEAASDTDTQISSLQTDVATLTTLVKKTTEDMSTVSNRVNMSIGVRK